MSKVNIYLDESGDLGWKFDKPYLKGGSSRYLTIASILVPKEKKDAPKRVIKRLYKKHKWPTDVEKKWADMDKEERFDFAKFALRLIEREKDIKFFVISVMKERVSDHIRQDANKLYNYMIQISLLEEMVKHEEVTFIPDPRSVKVASGNSLHDYLTIKLWFEKETKTKLQTQPCDSSQSLSIQFTDMLSGLGQSYFEYGYSDEWNILKNNIFVKTLYFK